MRRGLAALLLAAPWFLATPRANGQGTLEQAKTYFNAGASAYQAGQFMAAIQAFDEAYRLSSRPGILFSIAQAHRRQYYVDKNPDHLRAAIKRYHEYIDNVQQGDHRADAAQALSELEPMAQRLGGDAAAPAAPAVKPQTRLMVSSQTKGARVSLDGAAAVELPLIQEVKPGKHTIKVTADGYFDEQQDIQAVEGGLVPRDVPMREKPAQLKIVAPNGADITVDGRPMGTTPLPAPIDLPSGRHFVAVTKTGNHAFSQELDLRRGEQKTVTAKLSTTGQRIASYGFYGGAVVAGATGLVFMAAAYKQQSDAEAIAEKRKTGNLELSQLEAYDDAKTQREAYKKTAGVLFGAGLALGATGLLLYVFDQPSVTVPSATRVEEKPRPSTPTPAEGTMEVSAVPVWSPGFVGASVNATF